MLFTIATPTQQTITLALFVAASVVCFALHLEGPGWAFAGMAGGAGTITRDNKPKTPPEGQ